MTRREWVSWKVRSILHGLQEGLQTCTCFQVLDISNKKYWLISYATNCLFKISAMEGIYLLRYVYCLHYAFHLCSSPKAEEILHVALSAKWNGDFYKIVAVLRYMEASTRYHWILKSSHIVWIGQISMVFSYLDCRLSQDLRYWGVCRKNWWRKVYHASLTVTYF
jgi:hypothetical protein